MLQVMPKGYFRRGLGTLRRIQFLALVPHRPSIEYPRILDHDLNPSLLVTILAIMLDRLPVELVVHVLQHAAFEFRFSATNRQCVVHLATTSHAIYAIIAPILYHTLIVDSTNHIRVQSLMTKKKNQAAAARMGSHVRVLHFPALQYRFKMAYLTSLERISGSSSLINKILAARRFNDHNCSLRHLTFFSDDFAWNLTTLASHTVACLTHVCGFLPLRYGPEWVRMQSTPTVWTHEFLDALPSVTHLGLVLIINRPLVHARSTVDEFDLEALLTVVQTALGYRDCKLQRVALRVGSRYIRWRRRDIQNLVQAIDDSRFSVWWDERPMSAWDHWEDYECEDAMEGRDIWTEARSLF